MEACLTYGPGGAMLLEDEVTRRLKDFDDGTLTYLVSSRDTYKEGGSAPGLPNMTILDVTTKPEPGGEWIARMRVQGLMSGDRRRFVRRFTANLEGFDEGLETWVTRSGSSFSLGDAPTGFANMVCISCPSEPLYGGWWKWDLQFRGLMAGKPYKRRITVDGQTIQPGSPIRVTGVSGGWTDYATGRVDLPEIVVEDSRVVTVVPNTAEVPGPDTPDDAPPVQEFSFDGQLVKQWPNGWSLLNISFDQIPGTSIGLEVRRWKFKWPATF